MKFFLSHISGQVVEKQPVLSKEHAEKFLHENGHHTAMVGEVQRPRDVQMFGDWKEVGLSVSCTESVLMAYFPGSEEWMDSMVSYMQDPIREYHADDD